MRDFAKRSFDLVIASAGLLALAPVMAALAVIIKRSSPGPVFFRQRRIGRREEPFWLYKFRTMRVNSEGPSVTTAGDARITPAGRWMRHWKLDELPQLFNVVRGDMSLVGPRPEVPEYVRRYNAEQRRVLLVRPGITGPSQIRFRDEEGLLAGQRDPEAYYVTTLMPAKLRVDLAYLQQTGLRRDLGVILQTLLAIRQGRSGQGPRIGRGYGGARRANGG